MKVLNEVTKETEKHNFDIEETAENKNIIKEECDFLANRIDILDEIVENLDIETLKNIMLKDNTAILVEHGSFRKMCHDCIDLMRDSVTEIRNMADEL